MGNIVREIDYVEMVKREPDPKAHKGAGRAND